MSLTLVDESVPRTVYYERFCAALRRNRRFVEREGEADMLFPAEDVSLETNWPRYGNPDSAFIRGAFDEGRYNAYLQRLLELKVRLCLVNMHPFWRLPVSLAGRGNLVIADICLATWERLLNPRTVSMPAMAITAAEGAPAGEKNILASFRGAASHPSREALAALHDGKRFICELIDPKENHAGKIDATTGAADGRYVDLLRRSVFAFVPRGDALFSYRLAEVMSFGCVPIVLSDGWVLPFDRRIRWQQAAMIIPEQYISQIPQILAHFPQERMMQLVAGARQIYEKCLKDLDVVVESLLAEIEMAFFEGK